MKRGEVIHIDDFRLASGEILDVRSPAEFEHGHMPGAHNFPIFDNEERAEIGISYKKQGREQAIQLGFDLVGPRLGGLVRRAAEIAPDKTVRLHCWRGGMRSRSVAWCLHTAGFRVVTLEGGYKSYRRWVRQTVSTPRIINILGGLTGTGKTRILKALEEQGEQVLDLEGLASHRGSSFGGLGMPAQPSTQQFENLIAESLDKMDPKRRVWVESESIQIGTCWVAEEFFKQMKSAPTVAVVRPIEKRLDILAEMYGDADRAGLIEATERLSKHLGGERTKAAVDLLRQDNIREACRIILDYYDRSYRANIKRRPATVPELDIGGMAASEAAGLLIEKAPQIFKRTYASEAVG